MFLILLWLLHIFMQIIVGFSKTEDKQGVDQPTKQKHGKMFMLNKPITYSESVRKE